MKRILISIVFTLAQCLSFAGAATAFEISLLTCEPGPAVYEHYGHTALRVKNGQDMDVVFNYGCFDFNTPLFALRFALGQTDYLLGAYGFQYFEQEYTSQSRRVWEQRLNLTDEQAETMARLLFDNARPEHRVYRYNFLYNNCTTRCRDLIEQCVGAPVQWPEDNRPTSIRDMMHEYNRPYPWASMGIDLLLGGKIDRNSTVRERMFAPMYLMQSLATASVDGRPLAQPAQTIIAPATPYTAPCHTDTAFCVILLVAIPLITLCAILFFNNRFNAVRYICTGIMCTVGMVGIIPTFLFLFSQHPAVGTNLLVLCFNPLPLVIPFIPRPGVKICLNTLAFLMAVICLVAGTWYDSRHGFTPVVLLQEIPAAIYWILLAYTASLVGYFFTGNYLKHDQNK